MARDTGCFFWLLCGLRGVLCSIFDSSAWFCVLLVQRTANTIHEHVYYKHNADIVNLNSSQVLGQGMHGIKYPFCFSPTAYSANFDTTIP